MAETEAPEFAGTLRADLFAIRDATEEFCNHGYQCFVPCQSRFRHRFCKVIETLESLEEAHTLSLIFGTGAFGVDAEGAEFFIEEVPVCFLENARPVFDVQRLSHVFPEETGTLNDVTFHHDEARFTDHIGMESLIDPPAEKMHATVYTGSNMRSTQRAPRFIS